MKNNRTSRILQLLAILKSKGYCTKSALCCRFDRKNRFCIADAKSNLSLLTFSEGETFGLLLLLHKEAYNSVFTPLLETGRNLRILNIRVSLPFEKRNIIMDFSPSYFFYAEYSWHTIGNSGFHDAVHTFKFSRIERISSLDKYFLEDTKFNIQEYFKYARSLLCESQIYTVELKFSPEIAENVAEIRWHETQTASFNNDGSVTLKFRVDGLDEINWWILSYGNLVEVLEPLVLKHRIAEIARRMANSPGETAFD